MLEHIDNQITFILDRARKYIKGPYRVIPFLLAKAKARVVYLYQNTRYKLQQAKIIDLNIMEKRQIEGDLTDKDLSTEEMKYNFEMSKEEQK